MNLAELTPAPWTTNEDLAVCGSDGTALCCCSCNYGHPVDETNAAFVSLARNAFDVLIRRGEKFMLTKNEHGDQWMIDAEDYGWITGVWPDPFTALVEADKWYRENVERAAR